MDKLENQSNENAPTFFSLKKSGVYFWEKKGEIILNVGEHLARIRQRRRTPF